MNECFNNNGGCLHICNNTVGSHFCSCYSGYNKIEEYSCEGETTCSDYTHHYFHYVDIDECSASDHGCNQLCINALGSYQCDCFEGYTLANETTCKRMLYNMP